MTSSESQENRLSIPSSTPSPQFAAPRPISTDAASAAPVSGSITSHVQADSPPESHGGPALTQRPATRSHPVPRKMRGTHREISVRQWWRTTKQQFFGNSQKSLDARQKKTVVLGIILAVVFAAVLLFALGSGPSRVKAASKKINSENTQMAGGKITDNTENWTLPEPYSTSLRNPTKIEVNTSAVNTQSENTLRVQGIVYSSKKPSAIIANQVVFEGDSIEGARIIKIERDSVEFEKDGKRWQRQVKD
jgi:hypothetical protein